MSKYTTEVRFICETACGMNESEGYNSVENILTVSSPKVFDFYFPIFDESYRLVLERKILRHYYTQEIGEETVGLWKLRLNTRLNEIMPYYNKLYESQLIEFNPLYDADYYKDGNRDGRRNDVENTNGSGTVNRQNVPKNSQWTLFSDTPQGGITGIANAEDPSVVSNAYLTNATHVINDATGSTDNAQTTQNNNRNTNITTTEDYLEHVYGKFPGRSYSKLLMEYRETFLNIDMQIINELQDLFMGLW